MRQSRTGSARAAAIGSTLAAAALITPCPACRSPATAAPAPATVQAAAESDDVMLAADAGTYLAFFLPSHGGSTELAPQLSGYRAEDRQMFGAHLLDADSAAIIGVDPQRPLVMSSTIVDGARLSELLASPQAPPPNAPFVVRLLLVVPVVDANRAQAALDVLMNASACVRPRADAARWAAFVARLPNTDERRTAEGSNATYLCMTELAAVVVRMNPARRELRWFVASGEGSLLTAAAAPVRPAPELGDHLRREGFFSARVAMFKTPVEDARGMTALGLIKSRAGLAGVEASMRPLMWKKGAREVSASLRLVESPPRLFSGMLIAERVLSWTLTDEGRTFFSSLPVPSTTNAKSFREAIAGTLKPAGLFANPRELADAIHEGGDMTPMLVRTALWPHAIAFAAAHPGAEPILPTFFDDDSARVEIDIKGGHVRLHLGDAL